MPVDVKTTVGKIVWSSGGNPYTYYPYYPPRLTDDDIERIAQRVIERLAERYDVRPIRAEEV
jgi:hypothetical protein